MAKILIKIKSFYLTFIRQYGILNIVSDKKSKGAGRCLLEMQ